MYCLDDLMDFITNALFALKGMDSTDSENVKKLRLNKLILLDDQNDGTNWLIIKSKRRYLKTCRVL